MNKDTSEGIGALIVLLLLPVSIIINGLLLKLMWSWFLIPLGLPPVGVAHALGISLIVSMLTHKTSGKDDRSMWTAILYMVFHPIFFLIFGAIYHSLM